MENGWGIYEASQQRSRAADRDPYTKHMLRLRKLTDFNIDAKVGEGVPEVVLINAHDGTAKYHAKAGYFRFICANGMMTGKLLSGFSIQHTQSKNTTLEVLQAMEATVTDKFPSMLEDIDAFKSTRLEREAQLEFAKLASRLRYGTTLPPFPSEQLLNVRRPADEGDTVWAVLNRIQENVMNGGWETTSFSGRRSQVRSVERVSAVTKINEGLWDHAHSLLATA
jgi:hypothetical protein